MRTMGRGRAVPLGTVGALAAALALLTLPAVSCGSAGAQDGTARMVSKLAEIARDKKNLQRWYTVPENIEKIRGQLGNMPNDPEHEAVLRHQLGINYVFIGKNDEAIAEFEKELALLARLGQGKDSDAYLDCRKFMGVTYLRMGEQQNCIDGHNADSCLMPIRGGGVYKRKDGPHGAIEQYMEILSVRPDDLPARWLLNLAHMTLGDWPAGVPERWRIPEEDFASDYDIKRFYDVAPALGLDNVSLSGGSALEDFDRDGFVDLMVSSLGLDEQLRFFHNNGDGTFTERTKEAGLTGLFGGLNIVHTDYNNDGFADVLVLRGAWMGRNGKHPSSLLRNNGDGTFSDVSEASGVVRAFPTQAAAWGDFDNDGWVDLYVGNESLHGFEFPCELYRNNHDGTFTEMAATVGVANVGFVKGVGWGDYDNDGRIDLYLSRQHEDNVLYHNEGPDASGQWHFKDVTAQAGVKEPVQSFPTWWFDYNNDGWLDLFVCGFTGNDEDSLELVAADVLKIPHPKDPPCLYRNNHDGTFTDVAKDVGLYREIVGMGGNYGDFDNDGWLDFYIGTGKPHLWTLIPNLAFRNDGGQRFQDVTTSGGFGHVQKGHGVSFGDLDNDGDQDVYEELGAVWPTDVYQTALFLNPGHDNHWVTLELEGVKANRAGSGARIEVVVEDASGAPRSIYLVGGTGGSFGSSTLQQEIGLGQARTIRSVTIRWPGSGTVQTLSGIGMDAFWHVKEGDDTPVKVNRKPIDLSAAAGAAVHHHDHHLMTQ